MSLMYYRLLIDYVLFMQLIWSFVSSLRQLDVHIRPGCSRNQVFATTRLFVVHYWTHFLSTFVTSSWGEFANYSTISLSSYFGIKVTHCVTSFDLIFEHWCCLAFSKTFFFTYSSVICAMDAYTTAMDTLKGFPFNLITGSKEKNATELFSSESK